MIGQVVGNYRIVSELGRGGMGMVYRAEHTQLGRPAALKMLLPQFSVDPGIVQRFFNEARAASAIEHPGIVEIFDFGTTGGAAYIVMELLRGESMQQRLQRGPMTAIEAASVCAQVAGALAAAHARNIVHRDLKPDNIFLVPNELMPDGIQVKLLDFGIAKLAGEQNSFKTQTGALIGTPTYMSPEQCTGAPDLDHRTDLYALGCILFHALTGRPPFVSPHGAGMIIAAHLRDEPPHPRALAPATPDDLAAITLRLLAKEPAARFQTAIEVRAALAAAGANVPNTSPGAQRAAAPPPRLSFAEATGPTVAPGSIPPAVGTAPAGASMGPPSAPRPDAYGMTAASNPSSTTGASAGQIAAMPRAGRSKGVWIGAAIAVVGIGGAATYVAVSGSGSHNASTAGTTTTGTTTTGTTTTGTTTTGTTTTGTTTTGTTTTGTTTTASTTTGAATTTAGTTTGAATTAAPLAECAQGKERTPDTQGNCCWPQQAWSTAKARCIGMPACPPGTSAKSEDCVEQVVERTTPTTTTTIATTTTDAPKLSLDGKRYAPGTAVEIHFSHPVSSAARSRAWVAIARVGSPSTAYTTWTWVIDQANGATLKAPMVDGEFEVRLHTDYPAKAYNIQATVPFTVAAGTAGPSLTPPAQQRFTLAQKVVSRGTQVVIRFPEPMVAKPSEKFWVTVVAPNAGDDTYGTWKYVDPNARQAALAVPSEPGTYEVRLHANYPTRSTNVVYRASFTVQ